jgi:hypothetical protein
MHSQLYLSGRLIGDPELLQTKKGKLLVKLVLEINLSREIRPGEIQTEFVSLPISLFAHPAEQVKNLKKGDVLTAGCHVSGTQYQPPDGPVKRGVQLIADVVFL